MTTHSKDHLFNALKNEDLNKLLHDLEDIIDKECNTSLMIRLLKSLTRALTNGFSNRVKNTDVCRVAEILLHYIQRNSKSCELVVLRCVYYIVKHFLQKEEWDLAIKVKKLLQNCNNDQEYLDVYYALFYEFSNLLKKVIHDKKFHYMFRLKFRCEALEVLSKCGVHFLDILLKEAHQEFLAQELSQNTVDEHYDKEIIKFSLKVLILVKDILQDRSLKNNTWKLYMNFASSLIIYCLHKEEYSSLTDISENLHSLKTEDKKSTTILLHFCQVLKYFVRRELKSEEINKATFWLKALFEHVNEELVFFVCSLITPVVHKIQRYWFYEHSESLSTEEGSAICKFLVTLSKILQSGVEPGCIMGQHDLYFLETALKTLTCTICIGTNIIQCAEVQIDDTEFLQRIVEIEKQCRRLAMMMKGKGHLSTESWKKLVSGNIPLYQALKMKECFKSAIIILFIHMNACIKIGTMYEEEDTLAMHLKALQDLVYCCIKQKSYKEALIAIAVMSLFFPSKKEIIMKQWVIAKMQAIEEKEDHLLTYTMFDIFKHSEKEICLLLGNIHDELGVKMNDTQLCQMLVIELKSYATNSAVMYKAAIVAGKHVIEHFPQTYMVGVAIELVMKVAYKHEQTELKTIYEKSCRILENLKNVSFGSEYFCVCSSLGNIHYYFFFAQIVKLRIKLADEVASTKICLSNEEKDVKKGFVHPFEAEMKSNIITMYSDLNITKEQELLSLLNDAVDAWSLCCTDLSLADKRDEILTENLSNIEVTAHTFALYGYKIHCLRAWKLYYVLSASMQYESSMLKALSQMLEFSTYEPDGDMWQIAQNIEESLLHGDISETGREVLLSYYIAKSTYYLKNRKYAECMQNLQKVFSKLEEFKGHKTQKLHLIEAKAFLVLSKYQFEDCSADFSIFQYKHTYISASQSFNLVKRIHTLENIGSIYENSYVNWMMISAVEWITELGFRLTLYRDVYAYTKVYLKQAQILGLALRCGRFVARIAQIDLLNHNAENCEVKLHGIEAILQLDEDHAMLLQKKEEPSTALHCVSNTESNLLEVPVVDTASKDFKLRDTKFLDADTTPSRLCLGSPVLKRTSFKMPSVIHYGENCQCLSCNNLSVQNLILDSVCLKAQLHMLQGNNELAMTFFNGGVHLYKQLMTTQTTVLATLSCNIFSDKTENYFTNLQNELNFAYCKLLVHQSEFLFFCSNNFNGLSYWSNQELPPALNKHFDLVEHQLLLNLKNAVEDQSEAKKTLTECEALCETTDVISDTSEEERWKTAKTPVIKSKFVRFNAPLRKDKFHIKSVSPSLVKDFKISETKSDGETNGNSKEASGIFSISSAHQSPESQMKQNVLQGIVQKEKKQRKRVIISTSHENLLEKAKKEGESCSDSEGSEIFIRPRRHFIKTYEGKKNVSAKKGKKELNKSNTKKEALNSSSDDSVIFLKTKKGQLQKPASDRVNHNCIPDMLNKAVRNDNAVVSQRKKLQKKTGGKSPDVRFNLRSKKGDNNYDSDIENVKTGTNRRELIKAEKTKQKELPRNKKLISTALNNSPETHTTHVSKKVLLAQNEIEPNSVKILGPRKKKVAGNSTTYEVSSCNKVNDQCNSDKKQPDDASSHKYLKPQRKKKNVAKNPFVL